MPLKIRILLLLIFLFFKVTSARCQKVALVLSGGGAKGLAHVGVIKALEENEIPIDYVVGTSMGGVIGGTYAAGYSADEIEALVTSVDFQNWVYGQVDRRYNDYYSKKDIDPSWLSLKLSVDSLLNANFNSTLASDLTLNFALSEQLARQSAAAHYDFDSLLVPLRVVTSEIFTQQEVIIAEGNLSDALRATLSVPLFYRPIKVSGKYLFDGGIYNNFPVDVAQKEFNPDIIIGVNVSSKVFDEYPYHNDDQLVNQSLLYMFLDKSDPTSLEGKGAYVEPNLKGYSSFDFKKVKSLIDSGYSAGLREVERIKTLIERRKKCSTLAKERNAFANQFRPYHFSDIKFHGFNSKQQRYIKKVFFLKKGEEFYLKDLKKGYFRLTSEEFFRTIYPNIVYDEKQESYELAIKGRPENNLNLDFGGTLASKDVSHVYLGLSYYHFGSLLTKFNISAYAGNFYKSFQARPKINFPGRKPFYVEPKVTINRWDFLDISDVLIREESPTIMDNVDRSYGLGMGMPLGSKYKLIMSVAHVNNTNRYSNRSSLISTDILDKLDLEGQRYGFSLSSNTLNRKQYANQGKRLNLSADYFTMEENYFPGSTAFIDRGVRDSHQWLRLKLQLEHYLKAGKYSYGYYLEGVASNQPFFSNFLGSVISSPSFNPLQDSRTLFLQKLRAHNFLGGGFRNIYAIRPNLDLRAEAYMFKAFNGIVESFDQSARYGEFEKGFFFVGTLGAVLHSPVGPISASLNYYDDPETRFGVLIHVGYLLFNKHSLD